MIIKYFKLFLLHKHSLGRKEILDFLGCLLLQSQLMAMGVRAAL